MNPATTGMSLSALCRKVHWECICFDENAYVVFLKDGSAETEAMPPLPVVLELGEGKASDITETSADTEYVER